MGTGKSKVKKAAKRDIRIQRTNIKTICKDQKSQKRKPKASKPGRKQTAKPVKINDADQIKITVEHFWRNKINEIIDKIPDHRKTEMCTYTLRHLTWLGIIMFIFRLGSRNQLFHERDTDQFLSNLLTLSASEEEFVAHPDTMNGVFEVLPVEYFESLKVQLVKELIKNKALDSYRFLGSFRIAVDATGIFTFKDRHCEHCLLTKHNDNTTTYSHKMLEAKLVAENGFAFSVCSESIENINGEYKKQDCELNAFYRMAKKLKQLFPRTPICLLLDGIYACEKVFNICKLNNWDYIIVLKPERIPTFYKEAQKTVSKFPKNALTLKKENSTEKITWVQAIQYRKCKHHVIFCSKTESKNGKEVTSNNSWVTNIRPKLNNIETLINKGARQRWKIENQGFKEQKCDGYNLEHLYGEKTNAWKNYYQLIQIACIISQLIIYSDLCEKLQKKTITKDNFNPIKPFRKYYNSIIGFVNRLRESFRNNYLSLSNDILIDKIQIRFSSG